MGKPVDGLAVVIPARLAATRFPRKLLARAAGRSVLEWTWGRAAEAVGAAAVWIATDSDEIAVAATSFGAAVLRTGEHPSGTDRVAAAVELISPRPEWIINLQGDEPLIDPRAIAALAAALRADRDSLVTCAAPLASYEAWHDPSVVKVACGAGDQALYFSRAPIPAGMRGAGRDEFERLRPQLLAHVGIYGYPRGVLGRLLALPPAPLEVAESLEQLRALEARIPMRIVRVAVRGPGVDTPGDLERVEAVLLKEKHPTSGQAQQGEMR